MAVSATIGTGRARAYVRQTVAGDPSRPLVWTRERVEVRPAWRSAQVVETALADAALAAAMSAWNDAGGGCAGIELYAGPEATGARTNLDGGDPDGQNRIVWRAVEWPADAAPEALALTTARYDPRSGRILDADIDLNAVRWRWSAAPEPPADHHDLENTLAHELGHLLGFAHTPDPEATMFGSAEPGETNKRDLAPDDVAAICEVYPAGRRLEGRPARIDPVTLCGLASSPRVGVRGTAIRSWLLALALGAAIRRPRRPRRHVRPRSTAPRAGA